MYYIYNSGCHSVKQGWVCILIKIYMAKKSHRAIQMLAFYTLRQKPNPQKCKIWWYSLSNPWLLVANPQWHPLLVPACWWMIPWRIYSEHKTISGIRNYPVGNRLTRTINARITITYPKWIPSTHLWSSLFCSLLFIFLAVRVWRRRKKKWCEESILVT